MATRADLVRQSLHRTFKPNARSIKAILLSPEAWDVVLWLTGGLGDVMSRADDPRVAMVGKSIRRSVDYVTTENVTSLPLPAEEPPVVHVNKRRLLLQVQLLQNELDQLDKNTDAHIRIRLEVKIETLLELLTSNE